METIAEIHIEARVVVYRECKRNFLECVLKTDVTESGSEEISVSCESCTGADTETIEELETASDRNIPIKSVSNIQAQMLAAQ